MLLRSGIMYELLSDLMVDLLEKSWVVKEHRQFCATQGGNFEQDKGMVFCPGITHGLDAGRICRTRATGRRTQ